MISKTFYESLGLQGVGRVAVGFTFDFSPTAYLTVLLYTQTPRPHHPTTANGGNILIEIIMLCAPSFGHRSLSVLPPTEHRHVKD